MLDRCTRNIVQYPNINLIVAPWHDYTKAYDGANYAAKMLDAKTAPPFDLIHVDAEHSFYDTFGIGDWACTHAPVVLFHDTVSFPDTVMPACRDLAAKHDRMFFNYDQAHGLGILVDKQHQP
jgi:hypothetical protein